MSNFLEHKKHRESRGKPSLAIVIHGPNRDYDHALFCCDHNVEAEEFAAEWTAAMIDQMDPGDDATFRIEVRLFEVGSDECCVCSPPKEEP